MLFVLLGVLETRDEWRTLQSKAWVQHYMGSDKYLQTKQYNRVHSLRKFLSPLKVTLGQTKLLLKEAEHAIFGDIEENAITEQEAGVGNEVEQEFRICEAEVDEEVAGDIELQEGGSEILKVKISRDKRWLDINKCLKKSDYELFVKCIEVSDDVRSSKQFKIRQKNFTELYLAEKSPTELLDNYVDIPPVVLDSKQFKKKVSKVPNEERSRRLVLNNLSETVITLKKSPSKKNREIVKIVAAAAASVRYVCTYICN